MPVNNPAPAIRPPRARDELAQTNPQTAVPASQAGMQTMGGDEGGREVMERDGQQLQGFDMSSAQSPARQNGPAPTAMPTRGGSSLMGDMFSAYSGGGSGYGAAPPAGGAGLNQSLTDYATESLNANGRYNLPLVQQAIAMIDSELERGRGRAMSALDEGMSQRGLVGSTFEGQMRGDLEAGLEGQRMERLVDLQERMAQTVMQDRQTAANIGTQVGQFGLDQQTVNLRAQELQQRAALEGRSLDIQEARLQAENEQFYAGLANRQHEFAQQMGLDRQRFAFEQQQFSATMAEQVAARLQQNDQFAASLAQEDAQFAIRMGLEGRALDLQQQGMEMDEAFRRAEMEMTRDLETRALDLQQQGMDADAAYRRAVLEQENDHFKQNMGFERERWNDTSSLSRLDILLRALSSPNIDADGLQAFLNGQGGQFGGGDYGGQGTVNTGGSGGGGGDQLQLLMQLLSQGG